MGYLCPVCGDPQADGVHLANHLAFTAMVRGGDHEAWLDERAPDWAAKDDEGLAAVVTELAESAEYPQVFEDTTGTHDHRGGSGTPVDEVPVDVHPLDDPEMDSEASDILAEAREMTRQRRSEGQRDGDPKTDGEGRDRGDES